MIIKVKDIPAEGFNADFEIPSSSLNDRVKPTEANVGPNASHLSPDYVFDDDSQANFHLNLEGTTIVLKGNVSAKYQTPCARCAEDTKQEIKLNLQMILKPISSRDAEKDSDEDIDFGFYDGKEVNCSVIVEEQLVLALPFSALCSESCKGLCVSCGTNLNDSTCECKPTTGDERFAVLQSIKFH